MTRIQVMRMHAVALCAAGLFSVSAAPAAAISLKNGDFDHEQSGREWSMPKAWAIEHGVGRAGTAALVWENGDPKYYAFPSQRIKVVPGNIFRFGGWAKVERGKIRKPRIMLEYFDANGKWIDNVSAAEVVDNLPDKKGWVRYEGKAIIPRGAAFANFSAVVVRGCTGRVLFDDFTLEKLPEAPLVYLQSSAHRDTFAAEDGEIMFVAMLRLNLVENALSDYSCEYGYVNAAGERVAARVSDFDGDAARFSIPAAEMAMGRQDVRFRLRCRGETAGKLKLAVTRVEKPPVRRFGIDRCGRATIAGKKFFPLGMYTNWEMTEADIRRWKEAPFNYTTHYCRLTREDLDRFAAAGTYVVTDVRHLVLGYDHMARGTATIEESRAGFERYLSGLASHPAFMGWYLVDEAPVNQIPGVIRTNELLHEIAPDYLSYFVTDKPQTIRDAMPAADVFGVDPYPVGGHITDIALCSKWAEMCREGTFGFRPMWHVPQYFDWNWYPESKNRPGPVYCPTREEMANMTWQGIAAGANGICGYTFSAFQERGEREHPERKEECDRLWKDICAVAREVKSTERVLLGEDVNVAFKGLPDNLVTRAYRLDGEDYLLLVNRTRNSVAAELSPERGGCKSLSVLCGAGVEPYGGRLRVSLPGLGYAFVRLCF
ncbi:MAG: hypothetical protein IJG84_22370 [Kiritimatiellae bacterium]|nr:hypothetical protein [Kiritimatiellia bacterium]